MATLHFICGLPGSGKSTFARQLESETSALRFTPDEWINQLGADGHDEKFRAAVERLQWELAQKALARGLDVILENGFWTRRERDEYRAQATAMGARVKLHYLNVPLAELKRRILARNAHLRDSTFAIPVDKLDEWARVFEAPTADEFT